MNKKSPLSKTYIIYIVTTLALAAMAACTDDHEPTPQNQIQFAVSPPPAFITTRTAIDEKGKVTWEEGDVLHFSYIFRDANSVEIGSRQPTTLTYRNGTWIPSTPVYIPLEAARILYRAAYIGNAEPGELITNQQFYHVSINAPTDTDAVTIEFKKGDIWVSRIDFSGLEEGDKITFTGTRWSFYLLIEESTNFERYPIPADFTLTADANGCAEIYTFINTNDGPDPSIRPATITITRNETIIAKDLDLGFAEKVDNKGRIIPINLTSVGTPGKNPGEIDPLPRQAGYSPFARGEI